jgi:hypothetical protein
VSTLIFKLKFIKEIGQFWSLAPGLEKDKNIILKFIGTSEEI